jgi:hypothetical protein
LYIRLSIFIVGVLANHPPINWYGDDDVCFSQSLIKFKLKLIDNIIKDIILFFCGIFIFILLFLFLFF